MSRELVSFVIPVFNEEANLSELIDRCLKVGAGLKGEFEIVLVDDGSADESEDLIREAATRDPAHVLGVFLNRNYGQHAAVMAGYSVLFRTASDVIEHLQCDSPQLRRRRINAYSRPHLLCIDELAYLSYDDNAADLLYEVINRRYEKRSVIITTNRTFKEWNQVFPNATCIATLLDRLTHHADVTVFEGDSYRVHESEQESAARRKKRK